MSFIMKTLLQKQTVWQTIAPILFKRYKRDKSYLDYQEPWQLLIAVILSAQTTDDGVNKVTPTLFRDYRTPKALAKASEIDVAKIIRSIGYYNAKARYIVATAKILVEKFDNQVPRTEKELLTLPGVGRKTAVVVLANLFNQYVGISTDTHVVRFANRFGFSHSQNAVIVERDMCAVIPQKDWHRAGYAIKEYGRREGKARGYFPENDPLWQSIKNKK